MAIGLKSLISKQLEKLAVVLDMTLHAQERQDAFVVFDKFSVELNVFHEMHYGLKYDPKYVSDSERFVLQ